MAAELVGGAFLSSFLNVLFDRVSSCEVVDWIRGKKIDENLLQRLQTSLYVVQAVLNDAEKKQITDPAVKKWLANLQDAVYVADDLLDEVYTKAATQKVSGNFLSQSLNLEERELVNKIEGVIHRLESIVKFKDTLRLKEFAEDGRPWRVPSTSLVEKCGVYGRDQDREAIIGLLLDDNTRGGEIPGVVSIVGIGGIGKTTLAQLVYNDDRVSGKFNLRAWVCVAEKFDVINVTKTVTQAITSSPCNMNDFDLLQTNLKEKLTGKTFLIVLDDVWSDQPNLWKNLLKPFQNGNKGSKILVTTRSEKVASVMPTIPPYKLSILSEEDCWSVFLRHSFLSTESREYAALEQIGRRIVKKCKGLPLAVETLGGLLRTKCDVKDWDDILKSEIWEFSDDESMIIPALRISYLYLPSHLKRCFVYCSLYSQDYQFYKDELILLWMAEDFLLPMGRKTLEEIGCVYFDELVARSFFQPYKSEANDLCFVMHDLMHDLATFYAGEFYFRAEKLVSATEIGGKTRHLSCYVRGNYDMSKLMTACHGAKHMRTFVDMYLGKHFGGTYVFDMENAHCMFLSQFKFLRVLSFKSLPLDSLPESLGELIHLRYLDLSYTYIVALPESLGNLYNLQTLKLCGCHKLKRLPYGMQDLVNLRHLDIRGASLEEMPKGMSRLKYLHFLSDYIVGKHNIWELVGLVNLHGSLVISKLENVIDGAAATEARMIDLKHINKLFLKWLPNRDIADSQIERDILDKLQPHGELEELSIECYGGTTFPDWLGHSSYKNMTKLTLEGCENCCMLPSLGQLPSLKQLEISKFDKLQIIGAEFYKSDNETCWEKPFPCLEILKFERLQCWQEWRSFEFDTFPKLKTLIIDGCPMLIGDLPYHLPSLERLTILLRCEKIACSLPMAPSMLQLSVYSVNELKIKELPLSLKTLSIKGSQQVESVFEAMTHAELTCLQSLSILNCDSVISFPWDCVSSSLKSLSICHSKKLDLLKQQQHPHESLQYLEIYYSCDSLTSFPLNAFPNLGNLRVVGCESIKSLAVSQSEDAIISSLRHLSILNCPNFVSFSSLGMAAPNLESLDIMNCPEIDSFPEGGLPPNLKTLEIRECNKLVSCIASKGLHSESIAQLKISGASESIKSFPEEGCLPASLTSLSLEFIPSLETLDCNGLSHLSSLGNLEIGFCDKLENMTGQKLPASLSKLFILGCPLLGQRYRVKDSQIWPKISHIPDITIE